MANVIDPGTIACIPGTMSGDLYTAFSALVAPADLPLVETAFKRIAFGVSSGWVANVIASITDTKYLQVDGGFIIGGDGGGGGGGAPTTAEYILGAVNGLLPNGRIPTSTATGVFDLSTPNQLKLNVPDATTAAKGVVELATDGETNSGVAVQGNDSRITQATETSRGIVELATSAETTAGLVVQASDTRLSDDRNPLAHKTDHENGGSDEISVAGLSGELADPQPPKTHGSSHASDGSDPMPMATTSVRGTVELATDGETAANVVVQGNDSRIAPATTAARGIVELATDGEASSGVVVQGDDSRLSNERTPSWPRLYAAGLIL